MDNFSDKLIRLRKKNNYSMKEAAKLLDVPYTTYVGWEKGKTPNLEMLNKIATIFDVETSYFFEQISGYDLANNNRLKIGCLVKYFREQRKLSKKELANMANTETYNLELIEEGLFFQHNNLQTLVKISIALNIPFINLIKDDKNNILINTKSLTQKYESIFNVIGYKVEGFTVIKNLTVKNIIITDIHNEKLTLSLSMIDIILLLEQALDLAKNEAIRISGLLSNSSIKASISTLMSLNKKEPK